MPRLAHVAAGAALGVALTQGATAFLTPTLQARPVELAGHVSAVGATAAEQTSSWGSVSALCCVAIGAHAGIALAMRLRTVRRAEAQAAPAAPAAKVEKYVESAADARLFEQVYLNYTAEYLKGPGYFHEDKMQGVLPYNPGEPIYRNGKITSYPLNRFRNFSSNELAFISMLLFAIGVYGNLMFNIIDPQMGLPQKGIDFNVSYILESFCLPFSFLFHIGAYIQLKNGK